MDANIREYVNKVLEVAEQGFLYTQKVNWLDVRAGVFERAANAKTTFETHDALCWMADQLNAFLEVPHTFFRPTHWVSPPQEPAPEYQPPRGQRLEADFGYVWMPFVMDEADGLSYPNVLQAVIATIDAQPTRGWIVDLRDNDGGNCWPMLAGIGPVLGEGISGAFENAAGERFPWAYQNGASLNRDMVISSVVGEAYQLKHEHPPVAVLIGPNTASAAEVVAISFVGREQTRFFGLPTCGASTANSVKFFDDGARLVLTGSHEMDRNGKRYGVPIQPDETVDDGWNTSEPLNDACVRQAVAWLRTQG